MMDHDMWIRSDAAAFPGNDGDAGDWGAPLPFGHLAHRGVPSSLVFVGPQHAVPDVEQGDGIRIAAVVPAPRAAEHLRQMGAIDIVWIAATDAIESATLADLFAVAVERKSRLICETTLAALDRIAGVVPETLRTEYLIDADGTDRRMALAAARRAPRMMVHDNARGDAMERIDQLQEEVARISRLLGDLAGRRGLEGTPTGFAPQGGDYADYPGQVRAPIRDYAAIPRSFVPEQRILDRQRAKAVRQMLRQRRMREQFFPADLFADPAWDMLLDLYAARLERQPVSVSSLCIAAAVPATTALRWIKTMTDAGLFIREADPHDGRRIFIALAEGACDALARYFEALEE
ncbi:MAG TPA: MarR family winged helix-turn-helix transcriptional regulator [Sphingopyxis sp.]|jgi:DNA-binding MarR family transcriptional regulator|uniref:MarR family winged helix-turn-helix transcriptional regulator n=1 Tax=Sphingopyxis sp. TaxID=1908224 RepID=UPI002E10508E|nr:MarR family winged helix-turn-helix transcriptional regulator [Sphingopyxis sp.]